MWMLDFPRIWYATCRLKRRRKKERWSDEQYYRKAYAIPNSHYGIEGDKFARVRDYVTSELTEAQGNSRIIDLGTGRGYQARSLWDHGHKDVYACDLVRERISEAKQLNSDAEINFMVGDMKRLCFPDGSFDAIAISVALHDLTAAEIERALRECDRVLRIGGRLVIMEPICFEDMPSTLLRRVYSLCCHVLESESHL